MYLFELRLFEDPTCGFREQLQRDQGCLCQGNKGLKRGKLGQRPFRGTGKIGNQDFDFGEMGTKQFIPREKYPLARVILCLDLAALSFSVYSKIPKYMYMCSDNRKITVIILKFEQCGST